MNYETLVDEISAEAGINKEIFVLNFENEKSIHKNDYQYFEKIISGNYYFTEYQYWENVGRWKCVTLFVEENKIKEFVDILNSIFQKHDANLVDRDNPDNFQHQQDNFNVLVIKKENGKFRIDFAEN